MSDQNSSQDSVTPETQNPEATATPDHGGVHNVQSHSPQPSADAVDPQTEHRNWLQRVIDWLRIGYPAGVPPQDTPAVLFVLRRELTEADIASVMSQIVADRKVQARQEDEDASTAITDDEIEQYIRQMMDQSPTQEDVERVQNHLSDAGFPLENFPAKDNPEPKSQLPEE